MATTTVTKSSGSPTGHHSSLRVEPYLSEEKPVHSAISFLVRDPKHDQEKPYEITYDPEGVIPARNTEHEPHLVHIVNFRPIADEKSFETFGFSAEKVECDLTPDEYTDRGRVESVYYKVAEKLLREKFPDAALIKILEHNVRTRHTTFPSEDADAEYELPQPSILAHIDFTPESAWKSAEASFNVTQKDYNRLLTVNLWKSIQGPGNDWPLAICDFRTLNSASDTIASDVVYANGFMEIYRVYHNSAHRWYFLKDLGLDEAILFRQTDSAIDGGGGVAHAAFFNPNADKDAAPRQSIELRAFMFFD